MRVMALDIGEKTAVFPAVDVYGLAAYCGSARSAFALFYTHPDVICRPTLRHGKQMITAAVRNPDGALIAGERFTQNVQAGGKPLRGGGSAVKLLHDLPRGLNEQRIMIFHIVTSLLPRRARSFFINGRYSSPISR